MRFVANHGDTMDTIMPTIKAVVISMRPRQQIKNFIVFAPLLFSGLAQNSPAIMAALVTFLSFCFASGSVYIVNDLLDRDRDKHHPRKRLRPAAQGTLSARIGYSAATLFACTSFILSSLVSPLTAVSIVAYVLLVSLYSVWLKHIPLLDVVTIALGFVIRVIGGITAIGAIVSPWIIAVTFFAAWHIASTKREAEHSARTKDTLGTTRAVLARYSATFLRRMSNYTAIVACAVYVLYSIFAVEHRLFIITSIPFGYAMYRYVSLIRTREEDDPTDVLIFDTHIRIAALVYLGLVITILYTTYLL